MNQTPLRIGITCYPTFGGSGVIATEIGMALAKRGHRVHFICYDIPRRLDRFLENVYFHEVEVQDYPLFAYTPYSLSLASKMVEVTTYEELDILHVHYAVPHATSAYLAKQILGPKAPKVITTLHGTDITLVGNERSYLPITRFSITESDAVTVPSQYLKNATYDKLNVPSSTPIDVIPNFVNTETFTPIETREMDESLAKFLGECPLTTKIITHVSNFRPVKRVEDVIRVFHLVQKSTPSHLILIGDGPDRSRAESLVRELGLSEKVCFLGKQESFVRVLQNTDVFLLPSQSESFGLAALEAMSCGVPVIASNIHGLPEVVTHGETGFLAPVGDIEQMAQFTEELCRDQELWQKMSEAARSRVLKEYQQDLLVERYEEYYFKILS